MASGEKPCWELADSYDYLGKAGPSELAWEWLRRDAEYRRIFSAHAEPVASGSSVAWPATPSQVARWGCLTLPPPTLRFGASPILWSASVDRSVLRVVALPATIDFSTFDLGQSDAAATIVRTQVCEHVLLRKRDRAVRLDIVRGTLLRGPVALHADFLGMRDLKATLVAIRTLRAFCGLGQFPAPCSALAHRVGRQVIALRVHDALADGASIRDVGVMLYGAQRVRAEWPGRGEALKSHCRRLIALSRTMMSGGYRSLLGS